ncbi:MAG: CapA family protein [Geobacter sp.]|nr:CapA family protein [Geobacter sp.]
MNGKLSHAILTLFMCGDVMTGRGIDQILPHPSVPHIYEPFVRDAREYVELAEGTNGPIPRRADFSYIWGDALDEFKRSAPDVRIINLETSVTTSEDYWKGKGINYRMHPANAPALTAAGIDVCSLANNHVLDWGYGGLTETLETLRKSGIKSAGAGPTLQEAEAPTMVEVKGKGRVLVFAFGTESSGVPSSWRATAERPGVNLLPDLSERTARAIGERVRKTKQAGDIAVASIHWGGNWGYEVPREHREFARRIIDMAGIDIVHGHSSHHVKGIEVYRDRLIIYGCGDFITDYEGIGGNESYRGDLGLMYFASIDPATGTLSGLRMVPMRMRNFKTNRASRTEADWLADVLIREGKRFGTRVEQAKDGALMLRWK